MNFPSLSVLTSLLPNLGDAGPVLLVLYQYSWGGTVSFHPLLPHQSALLTEVRNFVEHTGISLMKKIMILAAASMIAFAAAPAFAAGNTASTTAASSATVIAPITISTSAPLAFGTVINGHGGVTVTQAGLRSSVTANYVLTSSSASAAGFNVTGDPSRAFAIASSVTSVTGLTSSNLALDAPTAGSLSAAGTASFNIGGTLFDTLAPGATYNGTISVTVNYN